jgi:hypothetical protein
MMAITDDEDYEASRSSWLTQSFVSSTHVSTATAARRVNEEIWLLCPSLARALVDLATDPNIDNYVNTIVQRLYETRDDAEVQQLTMGDAAAELEAEAMTDVVRPSCPVEAAGRTCPAGAGGATSPAGAEKPPVFTFRCLV